MILYEKGSRKINEVEELLKEEEEDLDMVKRPPVAMCNGSR